MQVAHLRTLWRGDSNYGFCRAVEGGPAANGQGFCKNGDAWRSPDTLIQNFVDGEWRACCWEICRPRRGEKFASLQLVLSSGGGQIFWLSGCGRRHGR